MEQDRLWEDSPTGDLAAIILMTALVFATEIFVRHVDVRDAG
jgi:hypothetical protein